MLELAPGIGLTGKVWASGCSAWVPDLSNEPAGSLVRGELAIRLGLRSAFAVPVVASEAGPILGIMTLLSRETLECDEPLLQAMTTLGCQIGLFAERRRAEAELMQVNARLNAVLDASTQVSIIATDPGGMITVFNPGAERMLGYDGRRDGRQVDAPACSTTPGRSRPTPRGCRPSSARRSAGSIPSSSGLAAAATTSASGPTSARTARGSPSCWP